MEETTMIDMVRTPKMLMHRKVQSGAQQLQQSRNISALRPTAVLTTPLKLQSQRPMTGNLTQRQPNEESMSMDLFIGNGPASSGNKKSGNLQMRKKRRSQIIVTNHFRAQSFSRKFSNLKIDVAEQREALSKKSDLVLNSQKVSFVEKKPVKTLDSAEIVIPVLEEPKSGPFITQTLQPPIPEVPQKVLKISKENINFVKDQTKKAQVLPETPQIDAFKYIMERLKQPSRQPILKVTKSLQQMEPLSKYYQKKIDSIKSNSAVGITSPPKTINQPAPHTLAKSFRIQKVPSIKLISELYAKPIETYNDSEIIRSKFTSSPFFGKSTIFTLEDKNEAEKRAQLRLTRHQSAAVMNTLKQMPGFRSYKNLQIDKAIQSGTPQLDLNLESNRFRQKGASGPQGNLTSRERYILFKRASHIKDAQNFLRSRVLNTPGRSRPQTSSQQYINRRGTVSGANFHQFDDSDGFFGGDDNQPPMKIQVYCSVTSRNQNNTDQ